MRTAFWTLLVLLCAAAGLDAQEAASALTPELIDFENTLAVPGPGNAQQRDVLLAAVTARPQKGWYPPWSTERAQVKDRYLRLAFKQPLTIGTVIGGAGSVGILKPDAPFPGDVQNDAHWQPVGEGGSGRSGEGVAAALVLPPGTKVRAIRFASRLPQAPFNPESFGFFHLLLLDARFYSPLESGAHRTQEGDGKTPETHYYFWDEPVNIPAVVVAHQRSALLGVERLKATFKGHPLTTTDADWEELFKAEGEFCSVRIFPLRAAEPIRAMRVRVLKTSEVGTFGFCLPLVALGDKPAPIAKSAEEPEPFNVEAELPRDGFLAMRIEDTNGNQVRNLVAEVERKKGALKEPWDLKDDEGRFVPPADYTWKAIVCPPLKLTYITTVYNAGRPPWWAPVPSGGGWLSDHCVPQSAAAIGEKVFIGAYLAESGHTAIALDPEGNKLWGCFNLGAWAGAPELAADDRYAYIASVAGGGTTLFAINPKTFEVTELNRQSYTQEVPGGLTGLAAHGGRIYVAYSGQAAPWVRTGLDSSNVDFNRSMPPVPEGPEPDHPQSYTNREIMLSALRCGYPQNGQTRWEGFDTKGARSEMVLVFNGDQPIGTVVMPRAGVTLSMLKPGRPLPDVKKDAKALLDQEDEEDKGLAGLGEEIKDADADDWQVFPGKARDAPVSVIAAPEGAVTRALKLTYRSPAGGKWKPVLPWMMLVRKRFRDIAGEARFASPQADVSPLGGFTFTMKDGDVTPSNPVVCAMKWDKPRQVRGVGLIGLTAARCEVDIFAGPDDADPFALMQAGERWQKIGETCPYLPGKALAVCLQPDMHVDFGEVKTVRALRFRMVEGARGEKVNPRTVALASVIAYEHLGGDPPEGISLHKRISVFELTKADPPAAKFVAHVPVDAVGDIAVNPKGELHAVSAGKVVRLRIEGERAQAEPVVQEGLGSPEGLAFDAEGNIYVSDLQTHNVKVFSADGKHLHDIGKPGGRRMGPYDPERMINPRRLAINSRGQLWVAEADYHPKRISAWTLDGKLVLYKLGPTQYGGGGWMDPGDRRIVRYDGMEFMIDWETGESRLANIIYAPWLPGTVDAGRVERTIRLNGRVYVVADPGVQQSAVALITRYDAARGLCVPLVAAGSAGAWGDFSKPAMREKFGKLDLSAYGFLWQDGNGDGESQPDEIQLTAKGVELSGGYWCSRVGEDLSLCFVKYILPPRRIRDDGTPQYDLADLKEWPGGITWRTGDGRTFVVDSALYAADGKRIWRYADDYLSVHGSHRAPRPRPAGVLVGEHGVSGHFTVGNEELFVTNGNHGDWYAFTADGLLAAFILGGPRGYGLRYFSFPECYMGLDVSDLRMYEEHFFGSITKADDGKVYAVCGHNHASVLRVDGLESMARLQGTATVKPEDIEKVRAYIVAQEARRRAQDPAFAKVFQVGAPRTIDGRDAEWPRDCFFVVDKVWNFISKQFDVLVSAAIGYDKQNLYLCVRVNNDETPMKNSSQDERMLFKGGDAVDLQLRTGAAAQGSEAGPQPGDVRVLFSNFRGKPVAVLYRYRVPGTPEDKAQVFASPWRTERVDRVEVLQDAKVAWSEEETRGYVLEAQVPLAKLGLKPYRGVRFRGDIGVLYSDQGGMSTVNRVYWSNKASHITSDVPSEVQIHPETWGHFLCVGRSELDLGTMGGELTGAEEGPAEATDDVIEQEIELR